MMTPTVDRFAAKVALNGDGCLIWTAAQNGAGYGKFFLRKERGRSVLILAHRWSYEHHCGPIPDGLTLDHLCRVPLCVNPEHLEAVTLGENNRRRPPELRSNGGTRKQSHCHRGHPLIDSNLYVQPKTGKRFCKTCRSIRVARRAA